MMRFGLDLPAFSARVGPGSCLAAAVLQLLDHHRVVLERELLGEGGVMTLS